MRCHLSKKKKKKRALPTKASKGLFFFGARPVEAHDVLGPGISGRPFLNFLRGFALTLMRRVRNKIKEILIKSEIFCPNPIDSNYRNNWIYLL